MDLRDRYRVPDLKVSAWRANWSVDKEHRKKIVELGTKLYFILDNPALLEREAAVFKGSLKQSSVCVKTMVSSGYRSGL